MIAASEAWAKAQKALLAPEGFVRIRYEVSEPGLQDLATESDSGHPVWSDPSKVLNGLDKTAGRKATCELNYWGLDGKSEVTDVEESFVSEALSGEDGRFATPPIITALFDETHQQTIPGVTVDFGPEWAEAFTVIAAGGSKAVDGNTSSQVDLEDEITGFNSVEVRIDRWSFPYHRARVLGLFLGLVYTINKDVLIKATHKQSGSILSAELPSAELSWTIDNTRGDWNPDNRRGRYAYLAERQRVELYYGFDVFRNGEVEWVKGGTFYTSEWNTPSNGLEASFTAKSILIYLEDDYTGTVGGNLYDTAMQVLESANIPKLRNGMEPYFVSEVLKDYAVSLPDYDGGQTGATMLQMIANAACCSIWQDRDGVLRIEPFSKITTEQVINGFNSYTFPEYTMQEQLRRIEINNGLAALPVGKAGVVQTMSNDLIQTEAQAKRVALWVKENLNFRNELSGTFRADPRLDLFDIITVDTRYGTHNAVALTEIQYEFTGAFHGSYKGRITDFEPFKWYSDEIYSGEVI